MSIIYEKHVLPVFLSLVFIKQLLCNSVDLDFEIIWLWACEVPWTFKNRGHDQYVKITSDAVIS